MPISAGVIVGWPSTAGSIPSGWSRVTALDDRYLKGVPDGLTDPGTTGGSGSHSHTPSSHDHGLGSHTHGPGTVAGPSDLQLGFSGAVAAATATHTHTGTSPGSADNTAGATPTTGAASNDPANEAVIWIESDGTPEGIPDGAVAWFNETSLPSGWAQHVTGNDRFLKGAAAAGNGGGTGGAATHTHTGGSHTHSTTHSHPNSTSGAPSATDTATGSGGAVATPTHTHSITWASASPGSSGSAALGFSTDNHEPPFHTLALAENTSSEQQVTIGTIAVWRGALANIPDGWVLCDGTNGTPDLTGVYVKSATTLGADVGVTGGAADHSHAGTNHSHSVPPHTHSRTFVGSAFGNDASAASINHAGVPHDHGTAASDSSSGTSTTAAPDSGSDAHEPEHTEVAFIQLQHNIITGGGGFRLGGAATVQVAQPGPTFPDVDLPTMVEAAFGADLEADPLTWTWIDLSDRRLDQPIPISRGKNPGAREVSAATCRVGLDNDDGQLTPLHPASQWYPYVDMGTPIRVSVTRNLNHGFEESTEDWRADGGTIERSTAQAQAGVASMLLTPDGVAAVALATNRVVPVVPGRSWIASGWVYSPNGYTGEAGIALELLDESQTRVSFQQVGQAGLDAGVWTYQELWFTVPAGVAYARPVVTVADSPTAGDVLYADEVRLRSVRFAGHANSWRPTFTPSGGGEFTSTVVVEANGPLRRIGQGEATLNSALRTATLSRPGLVAYWPLEDGAQSSIAASPLPGVSAARFRGLTEVEPGAEPVSPGSGPSVRLTAGVTTDGSIRCTPPAGVSSSWVVESVFAIESDTPDGAVWEMVTQDSFERLWITRGTLSGSDLTLELEWKPAIMPLNLSTQVVARGTFHQVRLIVQDVGADINWFFFIDGENVDGGTIASAASFRPDHVDLFANMLRVGHVAIYESPSVSSGSQATPLSTWPAVTGYTGETAVDRFDRLCAQERVPRVVQIPASVVDSFGRSETDAWGSADTGQAWTILGTASNFSVSGGQGHIVGPSGGNWVTLGDFDDVDLVAKLSVDTFVREIGLVARFTDDDNHYSFELDLDSESEDLSIWRINGGAATQLATLPLDALPPQPWWMRVRCRGSELRMKVWSVGDQEPGAWMLGATDSTHTSGSVGCTHFGDGAAVASFDDFQVREAVPSEPMGPQPITTFTEALRECEVAEDGVLSEFDFGLAFLPREARYNLDPALTVDMSDYNYTGRSEEVLRGLLDDLDMVNTFAAERPEGSTAVARDAAHAARYLTYEDSDIVNVATDLRLPDHASWRVSKGTVQEMRADSRQIDLASNPDLIDAWLGVELGDRITRTGLPAIYPPGDIDRVLTRYDETLASKAWLVRDSGVPYSPWQVGVYADDEETPAPDAPQRYDTAGSRTVAPFQAGTDTTLTVETTLGQLWTTDPADLPLDIAASGVQLRVTNIGAQQASLRSVASAASGTTGSFTVSAPAGLQPGDILVAFHSTSGGDLSDLEAMSLSGGDEWILLGPKPFGILHEAKLWWKVAGSSEPSDYTFGQTATLDGVAAVAAVSGGRAVTPEVALIDHGGSDTVVLTPNTGPIAGSVELRWASAESGVTFSPPPGFTEQAEENSGGLIAGSLATRTASAGQTGVHDFTASASSAGRGGATVNVIGSQQFTVQLAPVNGIAKAVPVGSDVRLFAPARYAL